MVVRSAVAVLATGLSLACGRIGYPLAAGMADGAAPGDAPGGAPDGAADASGVGDAAPPDIDAAPPTARMELVSKSGPPDWTPLTGSSLGLPYGVLTWEPSGPAFRFTFEGWGLAPDADYVMVQYIDPYPGNPATDMATARSDAAGRVTVPWSSYELDRDLTTTNGKVWLVPSAMIDPAADRFVSWDVTAVLFELDFVVHDDTDVP